MSMAAHGQSTVVLSGPNTVCYSPQSLCSPLLLCFTELSFPDAGPLLFGPFHHLSGSRFMDVPFQSQPGTAELASRLSPGKTLWPSVQSLRFSTAYHKDQLLHYLSLF